MAAMAALFASSAIRGHQAPVQTGALFYMTSANALRIPLGLSRWLWLSLPAQPLAFAPFFALMLAWRKPDVFLDVFGRNGIKKTAAATLIGVVLLSLAAWGISAVSDVLLIGAFK